MKIAHFISHPVQYFVPLYKLLYKEFGKNFVVVYARGPGRYYDQHFERFVEWDADLACEYEWEIIKTSKIGDFFLRYKPDVCWLHGYSSVRQLYTFLIAKRYGCKVWLRGESSLPTDYHPWQSPPRAMFLPHFFEHVDVFLAIGSANKAFYQAHGVPDEKIVDVPYSCDVEWWGIGEIQGAAQHIPVCLFVGKFLPHKRPLDVIDASIDFATVIHLGAGPLEDAIRSRSNSKCVEWVNQSQLRDFYYVADVLVVPSSFEPYGIVVAEAMAAGLPVVASDQVRATNDLVIPHVTGMTYPCGDIPALREAIQYVLQHRNTMGEAARRHVQQFSYAADLDGIRKAIEL